MATSNVKGSIFHRRILAFAKAPLTAALAITGTDFLIIGALLGGNWKPTLALVLLFEGGMGLLAGTGVALSSTPSVSKVGETMLGTAPWSRESEKYGEKVGLKFMLGALVLVAIGFGISLS